TFRRGSGHFLPALTLHRLPRGSGAPRSADGVSDLGGGRVPAPGPGRNAAWVGRLDRVLPRPAVPGLAKFLLAASLSFSRLYSGGENRKRGRPVCRGLPSSGGRLPGDHCRDPVAGGGSG